MTDITEPRRESPEPLSFATEPDNHAVTADMALQWIKMIRIDRPSWSSRAIAEALDQMRDENPSTVLLTLIAAARNPNVTTPDVILRNGVWRDAAEAYPPRPAPEVKVLPMMTARERKARGFTSFLDDPKMAALRQSEHEKTVKAARERGGHVIEENRW